VHAAGRGRFLSLSITPIRVLERMILPLPVSLRKAVANAPLVRNLLLAAVIATK
jgi:hypothetical protein